MKSTYLSLNHGKLYIQSGGKGNLVLCIAGGAGCTLYSLKPYFKFLEKYAKIVFFDPIGVGNSSYSNSSYSISHLMLEISSIISHFNKAHVCLIGHSFGGLVAQEYILRNPEQIEKLILICSTTGLPEIESAGNRFNEIVNNDENDRIISMTKKYKDKDKAYLVKYKHGYWKYHHYQKPNTFRFRNLCKEYKCDPTYQKLIESEFKTLNYRNRFTDNNIPTFIIDSENDYVWKSNKITSFVLNHPNAKSIIFQKSGHSPFIDERVKFRRIMKEIINK